MTEERDIQHEPAAVEAALRGADALVSSLVFDFEEVRTKVEAGSDFS